MSVCLYVIKKDGRAIPMQNVHVCVCLNVYDLTQKQPKLIGLYLILLYYTWSGMVLGHKNLNPVPNFYSTKIWVDIFKKITSRKQFLK